MLILLWKDQKSSGPFQHWLAFRFSTKKQQQQQVEVNAEGGGGTTSIGFYTSTRKKEAISFVPHLSKTFSL